MVEVLYRLPRLILQSKGIQFVGVMLSKQHGEIGIPIGLRGLDDFFTRKEIRRSKKTRIFRLKSGELFVQCRVYGVPMEVQSVKERYQHVATSTCCLEDTADSLKRD